MTKRRPRKKKPASRWEPLSIQQILEWADAFHARHGRWPNVESENLGLPKGRRWRVIDTICKRVNVGCRRAGP
jgi:hypothetical protein